MALVQSIPLTWWVLHDWFLKLGHKQLPTERVWERFRQEVLPQMLAWAAPIAEAQRSAAQQAEAEGRRVGGQRRAASAMCLPGVHQPAGAQRGAGAGDAVGAGW